MTIRICLAGATGWAGSALARVIAGERDLELVAAVSRTHAGKVLGDVLGEPRLACPVYATAEEALAHPCEVFFEYTKPAVARANTKAALRRGANVVVGTSGLSDKDYAEIAQLAERQGRAVLAVGNFALTVELLQKFAEMAARLIPQREIIDYASDRKRDAPSGTVRELAARLGRIRPSKQTVPLEETQGVAETRGARLGGSQVHSLRLPSYTISAEIIFGMPDQRLTLRHDSGGSALPYVDGALDTPHSRTASRCEAVRLWGVSHGRPPTRGSGCDPPSRGRVRLRGSAPRRPARRCGWCRPGHPRR